MENLEPIHLFTDKFSFTLDAPPDWVRNCIILIVFLLTWNYLNRKTDRKTILKLIYVGTVTSIITFFSISSLLGSINEIRTFFNTKYEGVIIDSHHKTIKDAMYKPLVSFTDRKGITHEKITDLAFSNPPKNTTKTVLTYVDNNEYVTIYNATKWFSLATLFSFTFFSFLIVTGGIAFFLRIEFVTSFTMIIGIPLLILTVVFFLWLGFGSIVYNGVIGHQELNAPFWLISFFWFILTLAIPGILKMIIDIFLDKPKKKKKKKNRLRLYK